jgi:glutathione S-transferase
MVNTSMRIASASLGPMIYHLTEPDRWAQSLAEGVHTGSSRGIELADEGFIHCSTAEQWPATRERYYGDLDTVLLLHIDESLIDSEVVYEQLGDAPAPFPHIYGPLPLAAVVHVQPLTI